MEAQARFFLVAVEEQYSSTAIEMGTWGGKPQISQRVSSVYYIHTWSYTNASGFSWNSGFCGDTA
jgi:hypothetical protein